ncbi:proton-conducting transporter membrane subunit [Devosia ginsengisoli]|uniref:proton-conducting transporter transmembrane domain-containing protein n=1 Tax=Devosia ginsengisoli TaxID=400770 RepID=UPI0026EAE067|nr:proton-conducting transporter membrane subunit [Devosia ginsengisoli]MCR6673368.1 Na+/H+ antiporter subunit D [Devosia ginsengisoli]
MVELPPAMIETMTSAADWVVVLPLVLCLMGAAATLMLRRSGALTFVFTLLILVAVIACEVTLLLRVLDSGPLSMTMGKWLPPFGISFAADIFGAGFALTAAVVTLIVLVHAQGERGAEDGRDGFHSMVLLLLAGVTGSFLTGDLFNLYVWFEVMLIASFGLLVLGGRPAQLDGAVKYGFINFLATTFFLLALGLLYGLLGTLNMADIMRVAPAANPAAMAGVAALLLLAFGMKAAAFPVNAWLPASYHTPPAVVSALFGGLLTKVGIYAMLRALVVLLPASRDLLEPVLVVIAVATLLIAPLGAIAETNLRRALGFFVIGGVGSVLVGIALPSLAGVSGAGLYVFHAILTMTAFYLVAGLVERRTGQTDTRRMGGLYATTAPVSILFFVLVLATAGVPPFLGFWPKLLLLQAGLGEGSWLGGLVAIALLVNAVLTLIAGSRLWAHIFWRAAPEGAVVPPVAGGAWLRVGTTGALVAIVVAVGLWPNGMFEALRLGAPDLLDPSRYVTAIGLAGGTP